MFGSKSISHRDFKLVKNKSRKTSKNIDLISPWKNDSAFVDRDLVSQILAPRHVSEAPVCAQKM